MQKIIEFTKGIEVVNAEFIRRKDGKYLFVQSPKWGDVWVNPGGHIEPGESVADSVIREVREETGLDVTLVAVIRRGELINPEAFHRPAHFSYVHVLCDVVGGELRLDKRESTEYQWVTLDEALRLKILPHYPDTIEQLRKLLQAESLGVRPGVYQHYKGHHCKVLGVAKHTETGEWLVAYGHSNEANPGGLWVRPLKMFVARVDVDGKSMQRFTYIGPDLKY